MSVRRGLLYGKSLITKSIPEVCESVKRDLSVWQKHSIKWNMDLLMIKRDLQKIKRDLQKRLVNTLTDLTCKARGTAAVTERHHCCAGDDVVCRVGHSAL